MERKRSESRPASAAPSDGFGDKFAKFATAITGKAPFEGSKGGDRPSRPFKRHDSDSGDRNRDSRGGKFDRPDRPAGKFDRPAGKFDRPAGKFSGEKRPFGGSAQGDKRTRRPEADDEAEAEAEEEDEDEEEDSEDDEDTSPPLPEVPADHRNPLLEVHRLWHESAPEDMPKLFDPRLPATRRAALLDLLPTRAHKKYAWSIPDDRALGVLLAHAPVVEVAAGRGYWGWALKKFAEEAVAAGLGNWDAETVWTGYDAAPLVMPGESAAELNKAEFLRVLTAAGIDPDAEAAALEAAALGGKDGADAAEEGADKDDAPNEEDNMDTRFRRPDGSFDYKKWRLRKRGGKMVQRRKEAERQRQRTFARAAAAASFREDAECPPWAKVQRAGPEAAALHPDNALFLCYPDEFEVPVAVDEEEEEAAAAAAVAAAEAGLPFSGRSVALKALDAYKGNTVIVAGESLGHTLQGRNPWGRSSAPEFQMALAARFHKVLEVPLPSWPGSSDTLSVWRRSTITRVDAEEQDPDADEGDDDAIDFKHIPAAEVLAPVLAAPATKQWAEVPAGAVGVKALKQALKTQIKYAEPLNVAGQAKDKSKGKKEKKFADKAARAAAVADSGADLPSNDDFGLGLEKKVEKDTGIRTGVPISISAPPKRKVMRVKAVEDVSASAAPAAPTAGAEQEGEGDSKKKDKKEKKASAAEPAGLALAVSKTTKAAKKATVEDLEAESLRLIDDDEDEKPAKDKKEKKEKKEKKDKKEKKAKAAAMDDSE